jgi:amino acid permease
MSLLFHRSVFFEDGRRNSARHFEDLLMTPRRHHTRVRVTSAAMPPELKRALGVNHAAAVVVGTVIGSGIFLVPSEMMRAVGSAQLVYAA